MELLIVEFSHKHPVLKHLQSFVIPLTCIQILIRKPEGKRPLGRLRQEDNIKMDIKEIGCDVAQDMV
jgi:hypothetical protein